ncbi:hypothetical protein LINPERHAP2_LOCUS7511, partial [Linum perenne]
KNHADRVFWTPCVCLTHPGPKIKPFPSRKRVLIKENCLLRWADEFGRRYQTLGERKIQFHSLFFPDEPDTLGGRTRSFEVTIERGLARINSRVSRIHQD